MDVEDVKKAWPKLIEAVKADNPVAATFLRAMLPQSVEGKIVRIQAQYELHRNYFEKHENQSVIKQGLESLLSTKLEIRTALADAAPGASVKDRIVQQEKELLSTVQEVFASKPVEQNI